MKLTLMEGNEAIGWGAVAAGCNFFAGYQRKTSCPSARLEKSDFSAHCL